MTQSCLFRRFASAEINEMKIDDVIRDFKGPKVLNFNAFYLLKEKHFVKRYITWIAWNVTLNNMPSSNFVLHRPLRNSGYDPYYSTWDVHVSWKLKIFSYTLFIIVYYHFSSVFLFNFNNKKCNCLLNFINL